MKRKCEYYGCRRTVCGSSGLYCEEHDKIEVTTKCKAILKSFKTSSKEIFELSQKYVKKPIDKTT